jgi:manganese/iron transport system substrate-binding protein
MINLTRRSLGLWTKKLGFSIICGLSLYSCMALDKKPENVNTNQRVKVVSTSTPIADWAQQIGGDAIEHTGLLKPGADPHVYEPVPSDSIALEKADLIIYNGYNLEPGLIKLINAAGIKGRKLAVGEFVKPLQLKDAKKGIIPDPHVWGDAKNAIIMVQVIRDELIKLEPEKRDKFTQNAAKLTAELKELDVWIKQQIKTIPEAQRRLVTTHDAFQYYANAYGIPVAGTLIGISTEEQPSAQTVKRLAEDIKKTGVKAIFAETTINPALIKTVAEEAGVKLAPKQLYSDSLGAPGSEGDTYVKMLRSNTNSIVESLGK